MIRRLLLFFAIVFAASAAQAQVSPVPPIIGGNLDLGTGTTVEAGAANLSEPLGLQLGGLNGLSTVPSTVAGDVGVNIGPYAGAALTSITYGMVAIGPFALGLETNGNAETVAIGPATFAEVNNQYGNTGVGEHVVGFDPVASYVTGMGNDSMRNSFGTSTSTVVGAGAFDDGQATGPQTVFGAFALAGNSGGVKLAAGTATAGDKYTVNFTSTNPLTLHVPATATYTVVSGDTNQSIANGLSNAINALGICYNAPQPARAPAACTLAGPHTGYDDSGAWFVSMHLPGGNTLGAALAITTSCTGTCGVAISTLAPFTGEGNDVFGFKALNGIGLTNASENTLFGDNIGLAASGNFSDNDISGYSAMQSSYAAQFNVIHGAYAAFSATNPTNDVFLGDHAGFGIGNGPYNVIVGSHDVTGSALTGSAFNNLLLGSNATVPNPGGNFQISIQNTIYATGAQTEGASGPTSGLVGIGQDAPGARLDVLGTGTGTELAFRVQSSTPGNLFSVADNGTISVGTSTGATCTGTPTSSFATVNGIVTHC